MRSRTRSCTISSPPSPRRPPTRRCTPSSCAARARASAPDTTCRRWRAARCRARASLFETCSEMMMAIHRLPQPVIAQVHGIATAAGCQLVAACDLAIASEDARFATSGVRYGLFCSTPMVEVSRADRPQARARDAAHRRHDRRADRGRLGPRQPRRAARAAWPRRHSSWPRASPRRARTRSRSARSAFYEQIDLGLAEAYEHTTEVMAANVVAPDGREGIDAFLGKREPSWRGRDA